MTVIGVSLFGGSHSEAAESRRRTRFAVLSALGFHRYRPVNPDSIGYLHVKLPGPRQGGDRVAQTRYWRSGFQIHRPSRINNALRARSRAIGSFARRYDDTLRVVRGARIQVKCAGALA
jgi:hypothetical protein